MNYLNQREHANILNFFFVNWFYSTFSHCLFSNKIILSNKKTTGDKALSFNSSLVILYLAFTADVSFQCYLRFINLVHHFCRQRFKQRGREYCFWIHQNHQLNQYVLVAVMISLWNMMSKNLVHIRRFYHSVVLKL